MNPKSIVDFFKNVLYVSFLVFFTLDVFVIVTFFAPDAIPGNPFTYLVGESPELLVAIFALQTLAMGFLTWSLVLSPILKLRRQVAGFLAGARSSSSLKLPKGYPELAYIVTFFNKSFEILWKFKDEFKAGRELRSEVQLAADIQRHVLRHTDVRVASLDIVGRTKSATEVGGDSYDIIQRGENTYVYLGDVTGHGVASGFVMMVVNALISGFSKLSVRGSDILANTNEILKPRVKSNMLMSLLMIRWNESEKKLYMSGAGHEYLVIYKKSLNKVFKVKTGGVALGMTRDISKIVKETQVKYEPGDVIVMYTDGITEARAGRKESDPMFGIDRLLATVENSGEKSARGIFNHITIELSRFMGYNHRQFDDITLITAEFRESEAESQAPKEVPASMITEWNWN